MPWLEINLLLVTSSKTCLHQFDFYCNIYPFFLITHNKMKTHWIMQKFQQLTKLIIKPTYSNVPNNRETKSTLIVYKLEVRRQFSRLFQRQMILKRMCRCSIFPDKALTNGLFCLSGLVFFSMNYAIFHELCYQMQFEVNGAKLHHHVLYQKA